MIRGNSLKYIAWNDSNILFFLLLLWWSRINDPKYETMNYRTIVTNRSNIEEDI